MQFHSVSHQVSSTAPYVYGTMARFCDELYDYDLYIAEHDRPSSLVKFLYACDAEEWMEEHDELKRCFNRDNADWRSWKLDLREYKKNLMNSGCHVLMILL